MRVPLWLIVVLLLVAIVSLATTTISAAHSNEWLFGSEWSSSVGQSLSAAKENIISYTRYKKLFNKHYLDWREQVLRAKVFMARAMRVFISACKYSQGEQDYFLSINFMSDRTKSELDKMQNKVLDKRVAEREAKKAAAEKEVTETAAAKVANPTVDAKNDEGLPQIVVNGDDDIYDTLMKSIEAYRTQPIYAEMARLLERLRASDKRDPKKPDQAELIRMLYDIMAIGGPSGHNNYQASHMRLKRDTIVTNRSASGRKKTETPSSPKKPSSPTHTRTMATARRRTTTPKTGIATTTTTAKATTTTAKTTTTTTRTTTTTARTTATTTTTMGAKPKRRLPLDRLINTGHLKEHRARQALDERSNKDLPKVGVNENYREPDDFMSMGMFDQQIPVEVTIMEIRKGSSISEQQVDRFIDGMAEQYTKMSTGSSSRISTSTSTSTRTSTRTSTSTGAIASASANTSTGRVRALPPSGNNVENLTNPEPPDGSSVGGGSSGLPNEIYIDHRDSGCMFLPRDQGQCGSCYAFASITLMEFIYCKHVGQLAAFSEQYMIDCGKRYMGKELFGCDGGFVESTPTFIQNFGVDLLRQYPFRGRLDYCPYEQEHEITHAGYIRADIRGAWEVPVEMFAEVLKFTPIIVNVKHTDDFAEYGEGVHPNRCLHNSKSHSMLIVGHGRQDHQEYWLIRNSYSVGWGEDGHIKIAKSSQCFEANVGLIFGSSDGTKLDMIPGINTKYPKQLINRHFVMASLSPRPLKGKV